MDGDLPFVDEHRTTVEAPREVVWPRLRAYVDRMLAVDEQRAVHPAARDRSRRQASRCREEVPEERVVLSGRHRFSRYALVLELDPSGEQTVLRALHLRRLPGPHGRVYRLLVISSHAHVVATAPASSSRSGGRASRSAEAQVWCT